MERPRLALSRFNSLCLGIGGRCAVWVRLTIEAIEATVNFLGYLGRFFAGLGVVHVAATSRPSGSR